LHARPKLARHVGWVTGREQLSIAEQSARPASIDPEVSHSAAMWFQFRRHKTDAEIDNFPQRTAVKTNRRTPLGRTPMNFAKCAGKKIPVTAEPARVRFELKI